MKEKIINMGSFLFSLFILIAVLGGGVIFLIFLLALIIGGSTGNMLATTASNTIMPYFIKTASISVLSGLIVLYLSGEHHLSLKK